MSILLVFGVKGSFRLFCWLAKFSLLLWNLVSWCNWQIVNPPSFIFHFLACAFRGLIFILCSAFDQHFAVNFCVFVYVANSCGLGCLFCVLWSIILLWVSVYVPWGWSVWRLWLAHFGDEFEFLEKFSCLAVCVIKVSLNEPVTTFPEICNFVSLWCSE